MKPMTVQERQNSAEMPWWHDHWETVQSLLVKKHLNVIFKVCIHRQILPGTEAEGEKNQNNKNQTNNQNPETRHKSPAISPQDQVPWVAGSQQRSASHHESRGSGILGHICFLLRSSLGHRWPFYWLIQVSGTNVLQRKWKDHQVQDIRAVNEPLRSYFPGN